MAVEHIILMWQLRICNLVSYRLVQCVVHHFMVVPLSVVVNACSNALWIQRVVVLTVSVKVMLL